MDRLINYDYLIEEGVSRKRHIPIWLEFGFGLYRDGGNTNASNGCHLMTCYQPHSNVRKNIYIVEKHERAKNAFSDAVFGYKRAETKDNCPISNVAVEDFERYGYDVHTITYNYN